MILHSELHFPVNVLDKSSTDLISRLLERSPELRINCHGLRAHGFFSGFSWDALCGRQLLAPVVPEGEVYAPNVEEEPESPHPLEHDDHNRHDAASTHSEDWDLEF
jgi:hypothetical protein